MFLKLKLKPKVILYRWAQEGIWPWFYPRSEDALTCQELQVGRVALEHTRGTLNLVGPENQTQEYHRFPWILELRQLKLGLHA
jgi:hypothetical protein